jgi:hypothetical protein
MMPGAAEVLLPFHRFSRRLLSLAGIYDASYASSIFFAILYY